MADWLTTHFPHVNASHPWNVYVKEKFKKGLAASINVGDRVAFYELKGKSGNGRQAIVAIGKVSGVLQKNEHLDGNEDEGNETWQWTIPCGAHDFDGSVDLKETLRLLGWPDAKPMIIAGGVLKVSASAFDSLVRQFRLNPPLDR